MNHRHIRGLAGVNDRMVILLDIGKLLGHDDYSNLHGAHEVPEIEET